MKENEVSPAAVARKLRVSLDFIYREIWTGRMSAIKRDGRWRVPLSEVERRVRERKESR